ncbi:uncharacterized protein LOC118514400 [Anopheles stephensi]|uniref:Uncharacterized protein n=1 Tax=Anopheles stephensi TaxID=30069 RepID=A0A182Y2K4_ANOST|nr:uncharacterized protein LOC118514400 [Anopheles stephensi]
MNAVIFVLCVLLATSGAVPVEQNGTSSFAAGLGAALTNIANSFVVVSEDVEPNVNSRLDVEKPAVPHLESANALPSLVHISLTPEEHHIKAETEELVYTNDTDAQGVVKITIVGEDISDEITTDTTTTEVEVDDDDDAATTTTTEAFTTTDEVEDDEGLTTTLEPITTASPKVLSTTPAAVLTVLGSDQVDKEKEEEIKENIKEVEAMPVIFTSGV